MRCPACSFDNPDDASSCQRCLTPLRAPRTVPQSLAPELLRPRVGAAGSHEPPGGPTNRSGVPLGARAGRLGPGVVVDNKYSIERVIGEGGMGVVYLAHDVHTDQKVVVKALHDSLLEDAVSRERVRSEGKALARIDHPNVVRLNAVVDDGVGLLLIMQFVDGKSLDKLIEERIAQRLPMPLVEISSLFRQVVMGVAAAHLEGLVHRDLKPANVLLRTKDGVAKVTDFGIAKLEDDAKAGRGKTQGIIGSLWYMSPEQVTGQRDLDKRVDIYALGVVLYELCCGKVPFDADSDYAIMRMHVDQDVPTITARRPDLPAALDGVIRKAAAKRREDRFQSCEELLVAFDLATQLPSPQTSLPAFPTPPPPPVVPHHGRGGTAPLDSPDDPTALGSATTGAQVFDPSRGDAFHAGDAPVASVPGHTFAGDGPAAAGPSRTVIGGLAVLAIGASAVLIGTLVLRDPSDKRQGRQPSQSATTAGNPATPATVAPPSKGPLERLEGRWVSDSQRHYDAVLSGGAVEFRIRDASELPGQNYVDGETRFSLRHDGKTYTVEDKIRPLPPSNATYGPDSRGTCQEIWTQVGSEPLRAESEGRRLTVDLVKFLGEPRFFAVSKGKVTSCRDFKTAKVDRIETVLIKEAE